MPRYAAKITEQELVDKILEAYNNHEEAKEHLDAPLTNHLDMYCYLKFLTSTVDKDLSKIDFDCENRSTGMTCFSPNTPNIMEVHTTSTGVTYYGCLMGGDWEFPIYFIIYWDGKELRGYIPTDGQCYDAKSKAAYGSGDEEEPEDPAHDPNLILADIEARIVLKGATPSATTKKKAKKAKKAPAKKPAVPAAPVIQPKMLFPVNVSPPIWSIESNEIRNGFYNFMASCGNYNGTDFENANYKINLYRGCKVLADLINNPAISVSHVICALERIAYESEQGLQAIGYAISELYGDPNSKTTSPVMTERYGQILASDFLAKSMIDEGYIQESVVRQARDQFPLFIGPNT